MCVFLKKCKEQWLLKILCALLIFPSLSRAEGSKDLYPAGAQGYRAYLLTPSTSASFNPFATPGTMKVYVKAGETIYVGSSAVGKRWPDSSSGKYGSIVMRTPNGTTYTVTGASATGTILNRQQELNGPNRPGFTTGGYVPYTRVVTPAEEGIWEIEFTAFGTGNGSNIPSFNLSAGKHPSGTFFGNVYNENTYDGRFKANDNWVQPLSYGSTAVDLVAAWDVSVGAANNSGQLINGRVFTTVFCGTLPNSIFDQKSFYSKFYVLTPEGFSYLVENNGQNGASFNFFSNNKGQMSPFPDGEPTYKSINTSSVSTLNGSIWDPRNPDSGTNVTNKLFFNKPASDLPTSANIRYNGASQTQTWLKNTPITPLIYNLSIIGNESGTLSNIVGPKGCKITFQSNVSGHYKIMIDVNNNGSFDDSEDIVKVGPCTANVVNEVMWDGIDGKGNKVSNETDIKIRGAVTVSEVHFPFIDVESNWDGIIIHQLDQNFNPISGKDIVYWNDVDLTDGSNLQQASNPIINISNGISSSVNGHKWGGGSATNTIDTNYYGNNRTIDTWTFVESVPVDILTRVYKYDIDLAVNYNTNDKQYAKTCNDTITYQIEIENIRSSRFTSDVDGATFAFDHQGKLNILNVDYTPTFKQSSLITSSASITNDKYSSKVDLESGAKGVFTIKAVLKPTVTYNEAFQTLASIIRPADYEDVDATDYFNEYNVELPLQECDGLPSGTGCNNIQYSSEVLALYCTSSTLTKTSSVVDSYQVGDTIEYSVVYKNNDAILHTDIQITDELPFGTNYVPNSLSAKIHQPLYANSTQYDSIKANQSYMIPQNVTSIVVQAWGAGGKGSYRNNNSGGAGGGGGGGAFAQSTLNVIEGDTLQIRIGAGSSTYASAGGDTYIYKTINNNLVLAKGGSSPAINSNTGANGGTANGSIGQIRYAGGNGASMTNGNIGGGGGAAGTYTSIGAYANGRLGGTNSNNIGNGGDGGNGANIAGNNGIFPGGGGGGCKRTSGSSTNGGNGANGLMVISYIISSPVYGQINSFPNIAQNWSVQPGDSLVISYRVVVENEELEEIINIAKATSNIFVLPVYDTVTDLRYSEKYSISGKVYHDANGMTDKLINGQNPNLSQPIWAVLTDTDGKVIQVKDLNVSGEFQFEDVKGLNDYQVIITQQEPSLGDIVSTSALDTQWVHTGHYIRTYDSSIVSNQGKSQIIYQLQDDVKDVLFGIQMIPVADSKIYNISNTAFIGIIPLGFGTLANFSPKYIIYTDSEHLTGNGKGGLLTGKDPEDCPSEYGCNTNRTFRLEETYPSTKLFYDFGGEIGSVELQASDTIQNYDASKLYMVAREGSGMMEDPIGFRYSLIDQAGFASAPATYTVLTQSALPVELLYFEGENNQCQAKLSWATASELNNDYFEIEKSSDAIQWIIIGKVKGHGTINQVQTYQFKDFAPLTANTYYRLKQVDFDGTVEYHSIIEISAEQCHLQLVNIYPNPAKDYIKIQTDIPTQSSISLDIYDMYGRILQREKLGAAWNQISTQNFANGSYLFIIRKGNEILFKHTIIIDK